MGNNLSRFPTQITPGGYCAPTSPRKRTNTSQQSEHQPPRSRRTSHDSKNGAQRLVPVARNTEVLDPQPPAPILQSDPLAQPAPILDPQPPAPILQPVPVAQTADPLDTNLSEARCTSLWSFMESEWNKLKEAYDEKNDDERCLKYKELMNSKVDLKKVMCPWYPEITMYTWIVIIMGILEVQFLYIESNIDVFIRNECFKNKMKGQNIRSVLGEFRNLAGICFAVAVHGPKKFYLTGNVKVTNRLLLRGGKNQETVLNNPEFYASLKELNDQWDEQSWKELFVNPIADWMAETAFASHTINRLTSKGTKSNIIDSEVAQANRKVTDTAAPCIMVNDLKNGKCGEKNLAYFNSHRIMIKRKIFVDSELPTVNTSCFGSWLIIERFGVKLRQWTIDDTGLDEDEIEIWKNSRKLAWTSETEIKKYVDNFNTRQAKRDATQNAQEHREQRQEPPTAPQKAALKKTPPPAQGQPAAKKQDPDSVRAAQKAQEQAPQKAALKKTPPPAQAQPAAKKQDPDSVRAAQKEQEQRQQPPPGAKKMVAGQAQGTPFQRQNLAAIAAKLGLFDENDNFVDQNKELPEEVFGYFEQEQYPVNPCGIPLCFIDTAQDSGSPPLYDVNRNLIKPNDPPAYVVYDEFGKLLYKEVCYDESGELLHKEIFEN